MRVVALDIQRIVIAYGVPAGGGDGDGPFDRFEGGTGMVIGV